MQDFLFNTTAQQQRKLLAAYVELKYSLYMRLLWVVSYAFNFLFRYQFFLQLKRDVLTGRIPIAFDNLVELCALVVQCKYLP